MEHNSPPPDRDQSNSNHADCPVPAFWTALQDAHTLWHQALDAYSDPAAFRANMNGSLQALRHSTFHLQSEISGGTLDGEWYEKAQGGMKADTLMRWLNQSRVTVVHQRMLDTHSTMAVHIVADYFDATDESASHAGPERTLVDLPVKYSLDDVVAHIIADRTLPDWMTQDSYVTLERMWIADSLPDRELLDALAYAFGFLECIHVFAHDWLHDSAPAMPQFPGVVPDCMRVGIEYRRTRIALRDGRADVGGLMLQAQPNGEKLEEAKRRYRMRPTKLDKLPMSPIDLVPVYVGHARSILQSGETHGWFIFFFRGRQVIDVFTLAARDTADKRVLAQRIARAAQEINADGAIEVGEVWLSENFAEYVDAKSAAKETRREGLIVVATTKDGRYRSTLLPFRRRRFGGPRFEDPIEDAAMVEHFMLPLRSMWGWRDPNVGAYGEQNSE